jgi:hypothetical protein
MIVPRLLCAVGCGLLGAIAVDWARVASAPPRAHPEPAAAVPTGFGAVPSDVRVVMGLDVPALARAPIVRWIVASAFAHDPLLEAELSDLTRGCALDPERDIDQVLLALAASGEDTLLVASGRFSENAVVACARGAVTPGGGSVREVAAAGRRLYLTTHGTTAPVWFVVPADGTALASGSQALLLVALGSGPKLDEAHAPLRALLDRARPGAAVWAAARVDPAVGAGLLRASGGLVTSPPRQIYASLDVRTGLAVAIAAVMGSAEEAHKAAEFSRTQLKPLTIMAQGLGLGSLVGKITAGAEGDLLRLSLRLSEDEAKEWLSQIDRMTAGDEYSGSN